KDFLLGKNCNADWLAQDFKYIPETDFAVRLMKQAHLENGFNILLYGAPGTGKTCFAQMLAKETQNTLFSVGEYSKGEMQVNRRLQALYFKEVILSQQPNACLLFDEAEDLFSSNLTKCNKVEINRLLENNSLPIIWITNKIHLMDPAFIRRFTLAIHFKKPPVQIQQKIWQKHLQQNQLPHSKSQALALAKEYSVPPSMIAGAVKAARLVNGDIKVVKNHLEIMTQALNFGRIKAKTAPQTETFNPALINADADLCTMTEQLQKLERLNFSLCLYGAPGTGKSAYGRYLADKLGLRVIQKRASDLLGCFVGETEENIAKAFAQAKENKSMLIFDEADSFLQDRGRASHSWEVSSVNEMLTWMESHPYPFICTTNLITQLDPASLRRFSFKVKYGYLNPAQVQNAFQHFFNLSVQPQWVEGLGSLTPGDFALVKNKAEILGALKDPEKLKQMLTDEQKLKETRGNSQIGFCANI
ncbi:MAG: ATP-binding protein, partial [Elusimicrobiaceae bacterium]|nr:ATP-binding protein [Elusimicrobiaceae bacterium]